MARKRSFLGKNPGGKFRGIPGNPSNGMGWGGVFKKKGDWGILNPMEWAGFASKMRFGEVGPRPQGQLQDIIEYNLGMEQQMRQEARARARAKTVQPPVTAPGDVPRRVPGGTGTSAPASGTQMPRNTGGTPQPKGGSTAPAGGKNTGAKPAPISAAVKAMKNPVKRGR
jgi:hypothetical protein